MASTPLEQDPKLQRTPVVRDSTFHRSVADTGLVLDYGRDMELAFLQVGPAVSARLKTGEGDVQEEGYEMEPAVTEVSRVRMSRTSALAMAMMIIEELVEDGKIDRVGFSEQIEALFSRHQSTNEQD